MISKILMAGKFMLHNLEAFVWIAAIIYFALSPVHQVGHFTICPLSLAGFEYCPGCGLGRAMILLIHGKIVESISMHPFALLAFGVLIARIVIVFKNHVQFQDQISKRIIKEKDNY
jgi:hypothetical protein